MVMVEEVAWKRCALVLSFHCSWCANEGPVDDGGCLCVSHNTSWNQPPPSIETRFLANSGILHAPCNRAMALHTVSIVD